MGSDPVHLLRDRTKPYGEKALARTPPLYLPSVDPPDYSIDVAHELGCVDQCFVADVAFTR